MHYGHDRWASLHDWYIRCEGNPHTGLVIVVRDDYHQDGAWHECTARFDSYSELRAWAGY